jgi:hypothetical protein
MSDETCSHKAAWFGRRFLAPPSKVRQAQHDAEHDRGMVLSLAAYQKKLDQAAEAQRAQREAAEEMAAEALREQRSNN